MSGIIFGTCLSSQHIKFVALRSFASPLAMHRLNARQKVEEVEQKTRPAISGKGVKIYVQT